MVFVQFLWPSFFPCPSENLNLKSHWITGPPTRQTKHKIPTLSVVISLIQYLLYVTPPLPPRFSFTQQLLTSVCFFPPSSPQYPSAHLFCQKKRTEEVMASLVSLSFLEASSSTVNSMFHHSKIPSRVTLPIDFKGDVRKVKFRRVAGHETLVGLRATGVNSSFEGAGDADDGGQGVVDAEALQASIEKGKRALAMQKDLLQQIAERRKLVSSINVSVVYEEQDAFSYNEGDSSFSNLDQSSTNGGAQSTKANISETSPVAVNENFLVEDEKGGNSSQAEHSLVTDNSGSFGKPSLESANSKVMPSFLRTSSDTGVKEKLEDLAAADIDNGSVELDVAPEEENMDPPPLAGANVMNIIVVAAECAPWSKTGGLGDVAGALPKALARRGHRVMVVAPKYGNYEEPQDTGVRKSFLVNGQNMEVTYFHAFIDGVDFVFIDNHVFHHCENNIYGGDRLEILKRMVLFCKAAVEVPWHVPCGGVCYGDGNLAFIANDWHTALLPVYLKAYYRDNGLMKYARSILVIHNIAHQGRGPVDDFCYVDLPDHYMDLFKLYDPFGGDHFNIFAAGLKIADQVVTVSHGYAWELKTSEGGWGLHGILNESSWKLQGIVNGVDTSDWNPELDVHLKSDGYTNYSLETLQTGKPLCKAALQQELGLPVRADVPVIGFIGRLDHQKGVDLIAEAIPWLVGQDVQLIMLGTGRPDLESMLRMLEGQYRDKVRGWVGFSVKMAHRITAGVNILLMPSRFEPCGLNQLYAMIYGTVPVVHAVGGLRDTVQQFDPYKETGFGWAFDRAEAGKLMDALGNCLNTYWNYKSSWEGLQKRCMMQNLSWDNAAERYEEVLVAAKYQW